MLSTIFHKQRELVLRRHVLPAGGCNLTNPTPEGTVSGLPGFNNSAASAAQGSGEPTCQSRLPTAIDPFKNNQNTFTHPGRLHEACYCGHVWRAGCFGLVLGSFCLAASAKAAGPDADKAYVEILQDLGAIDGPMDGPGAGPSWERVRIDLKVLNRLPITVRNVEVEIRLVHATRDSAAIPGWTFPRQMIRDAVLDPTAETYLRISLDLPPRRASPPAEEIAYRVKIISYQVDPPDLETCLRLLASSAPSDQRAALDSYASAMATGVAVGTVAQELAIALATLPVSPSAPDALRMLFAVQALGSLGAVEHVRALLAVVERRDRAAWGRAVLDLATQMVTASQPGDPRLFVLPSWARTVSALVKVRAEDALEEAVRDTLLRMGDPAVPGLLLASKTHPSNAVRALAGRVLHALGRFSVRSQLALSDRKHRLQVIRVFGLIAAPDPVPALTEVLRTRDTRVRETVNEALRRIGSAAVRPLVDALGEVQDDPVFATLERLGPRHLDALRDAASAYGITARPGEQVSSLLARTRAERTRVRRETLEAEVTLALSQSVGFANAVRRLNAVFKEDQRVYLARSAAIAALYYRHAEDRYRAGDYDAAIEVARTGLSIHQTPAGEDLLFRAQVALVQGFTRLGDLDAADQVLGEIRRNPPSTTLAEIEGKLLVRKAASALQRGETGLARALVDRARIMGIEAEELSDTHSKLLFSENLAVVIGMSLFIPAFVVVLGVYARRKWSKQRMARITQSLDDSGS